MSAEKETSGAVERVAECSVRDEKHVHPCSALSESSEYGNPRGKAKGIFSWQLISMTTGERSRTFFGVKSGHHVAKGIVFNFCPFCGTKIDAPFADEEPTPPHQEPSNPTAPPAEPLQGAHAPPTHTTTTTGE